MLTVPKFSKFKFTHLFKAPGAAIHVFQTVKPAQIALFALSASQTIYLLVSCSYHSELIFISENQDACVQSCPPGQYATTVQGSNVVKCQSNKL